MKEEKNNKQVIKFLKSLPERFDRTISGGFQTQLRWFSITILLFLTICVTIALFTDCPVYNSHDNWSKIQGVIYHFLDSGSLNLEKDQSLLMQLFSLVISFFGMVLLGGMLITTLSNIVERRVDNIERGTVVYKNIKHHYIIIGYGEISICLINDIFKHYGWNLNEITDNKKEKLAIIDKLPKIILLTSKDIPTVRAEIFSQLSVDLEKKIFLYSGNIESKEHISNLNINSAKEVYILGEPDEYGRDSKNIACVRYLAELRGALSEGATIKDTLKVNVQFDRMPSYSNIQKLNIPREYITNSKDQTPNIYFRPFNFYENWARILWSYYSFTASDEKYSALDFEPMVSNKHVHLIIVGFNRMGRALLLEALRLCHFPNYRDTGDVNTKITIIDKELASQIPFFKSQYPYLEQQIKDIDIEYIDDMVESERVREMIDRAARDSNKLLTIAICLRDPDLSLATGLNLPESVYYQCELVKGNKNNVEVNNIRTKVVIRQELQHGLGEILNKDESRFKNVKIFGMLTSGISHELLDDKIPMFINHNYELITNYKLFYDKYKNNNIQTYEEQAELQWIALSENLRWANRYQVDAFSVYIRALRELGITDVSQIENIDKVALEHLANAEHRRWIAERTTSGWRQENSATENRIDLLQIHNSIIPYSELSESEKEKDRTVIKDVLILDNLFKTKKRDS